MNHAILLLGPPSGEDLVRVLATFLVGWVFFAFTLQIAASYVIEDPAWKHAFIVGILPTVIAIALIHLPPPVIIAIGLVVESIGVRVVYRRDFRTTVFMALLHFAAAIVLAMLTAYLVALLGIVV